MHDLFLVKVLKPKYIAKIVFYSTCLVHLPNFAPTSTSRRAGVLRFPVTLVWQTAAKSSYTDIKSSTSKYADHVVWFA